MFLSFSSFLFLQSTILSSSDELESGVDPEDEISNTSCRTTEAKQFLYVTLHVSPCGIIRCENSIHRSAVTIPPANSLGLGSKMCSKHFTLDNTCFLIIFFSVNIKKEKSI